jgi:serine/threonine-protein kinase
MLQNTNSVDIKSKYINKDNLKQLLSEYFTKNKNLYNIYGEFVLTKKSIGNGGTSNVKEFELNNKKYAVKFLLENISKKETTVFKRFKQAHLNLLTVQSTGAILPQIHMDYIEISDEVKIPYILMPLAKMTLKEYVQDKKQKQEFNSKIFINIFDKLLDIINIIHSHKIIHRDIKPENIFIYNDKLVLGDFDIAKFDKEEYIKLIETQKSERLANFHYSAPEQSLKEYDEIGYEADWYAFGQTLYWLIENKTLRGQEKITLVKEYKKYESLIQNLLSENPKERLKNKEEILNHLKSKDVLSSDEILYNFEDIIFKYMFEFGQNREGIKEFTSLEEINEIIEDLSENPKKLNLWWSQGYSDNNVKEIKKLENCEHCWLVDHFEIKIKSIWIFKHYYNLGCSTIIIEADEQSSTGVYDNTYEIEEVGYYKGKYFDRAHFDVGWTIIDGKRIKLNGKADIRVRIVEKNIFFIAPQNGPLITHNALINKIYQEYSTTKIVNRDLLSSLTQIKKPQWSY